MPGDDVLGWVDDMGSEGFVGATMPDLFRLAMRQSAVAMCLVGADGRFLAVNPAACDLFARPSSVLVTLTFQELTHPEDLECDMALLRQALAGEIDSYRLLKRYLRPDGSIVHGDLNVTAIRADDDDLIAFLSLIVDVTERELARDSVAETRNLLRGVIDTQLDPWVYLRAVRDHTGTIVDFDYADANDAALRANRMDRDALMATTLLGLLPSHATNGLLEAYRHVVDSGEPLVLDDHPFVSELTDGQTRWFDNRAVRVGDGLSLTWRDVTDRVQLRKRLHHQAQTDPLTGLANRAGLQAAVSEMRGRSRRQGDRLACYYCDVDNLKATNDELGHDWGDLLLRTVGDRILGVVRGGDVAARIGGDEFVVVADGVPDEDSAAALAVKIAGAVSRPLMHAGVAVMPSVSIGVALADATDDLDSLLRRADASLYRAKQARTVDSQGMNGPRSAAPP
jgi:diguanylate cyclase (GGDEF)-like protein/PAS domain S-box-containing protein